MKNFIDFRVLFFLFNVPVLGIMSTVSLLYRFSCCASVPSDDSQYVCPKHVVLNKSRTYTIYVLCLCVLYLPVVFNPYVTSFIVRI
jgi:hypothetical protein